MPVSAKWTLKILVDVGSHVMRPCSAEVVQSLIHLRGAIAAELGKKRASSKHTRRRASIQIIRCVVEI